MRTEVAVGLGGWATRWDELASEAPLPSPFMTSWWIGNVDPEVMVVGVLDSDELIGGLALRHRRRRGTSWWSLPGNGPLEPDHLDAVAARGRRRDVSEALARWITATGGVFDLDGLVADSIAAAALGLAGAAVTLHIRTPAPYVTLPDDFEAYLASRHGKLRSTIKRTRKRLEATGVTARIVDPSDVTAVVAAMDSLRRLHDTRWGGRSGFLDGWDGFAAAILAGAAAGDVQFTELVDSSGTAIATELDLRAGRRLCFYQAGRLTDHDLRGSGSVLKADIVAAAIGSGCNEYDLLRGDEPYKAEWAAAAREVMHVRAAVGLRARSQLVAAGAVRRIRARG